MAVDAPPTYDVAVSNQSRNDGENSRNEPRNTVLVVCQPQQRNFDEFQYSMDPTTVRMKALIIASLSLFCGVWCCAVPALALSLKKSKSYRVALIIASIGLLTGIAALMVVIIFNVLTTAHLSLIVEKMASKNITPTHLTVDNLNNFI